MNLKSTKIVFLGILFITPLLEATGNFGYEQIKVLFFLVSISLIGFLWMGRGMKWTLITAAAGLFVLILLVTSLIGLDPKTSILGKSPYYQGWILYLYLFLFYLLVKTFKIELSKYALALSVSALLVSVWAIYDWVLLNIFNQSVSTYAGRVVSTFGQPNFYAGFLLLTLPFSYLLFKNPNKKLRYLGWGSGLLSVVGIIVSYSKSAILLGLLLLVLGLVSQLRIKFKLGLVAALILAVSIFIALKFSSGIVGNEFSQPITTTNPDLTRESVEKRVYIWPIAWKLVLQKLPTGYGLENINRVFAGYFKDNYHSLFEANLKIFPVLISLKDLNIDRSHNYFLDLLLFAGILGLLAWIFLISLLFWKLGQMSYGRGKNVLLVYLITYLIWVQFQNQGVVHLVYFWLLAGLIDQDDP